MARRSRHNLSFTRLFSADAGQVVPCGLVEGLPGDQLRINSSAFIRLSPMAAPVMQSMHARVYSFFVPHRLTMGQEAWENFITGGPDGRDASVIPTMATTGVKGDVMDYLGLPRAAGVQVSTLPVAAYNMIWNEWFRDQDLIPTLRELTNTTVARAAWDKDYFSTARPWPQKGDEVTLPLGDQAPVIGLGKQSQAFTANEAPVYETGAAGPVTYPANENSVIDQAQPDASWRIRQDPANPGFPGVFADLSEATAATINALRRAFALQRFAENRARYGSRYPELLRAWGVRPQDARLQRPELLSVSSADVGISEVLQTSGDFDQQPEDARFGVGDMYGHGVALARGKSARVRLAEHGYVLSLLVVRPRPMYTNGIERTFLRETREDFWQPELQYIGQEAILQDEVYAAPGQEEQVFGWTDRYESYRYQRSGISGDFRDQLDYWHQGRVFDESPALNETFVTCTPSRRIYNVQTEDPLWCTVQHRISARRLVTADRRPRVL